MSFHRDTNFQRLTDTLLGLKSVSVHEEKKSIRIYHSLPAKLILTFLFFRFQIFFLLSFQLLLREKKYFLIIIFFFLFSQKNQPSTHSRYSFATNFTFFLNFLNNFIPKDILSQVSFFSAF